MTGKVETRPDIICKAEVNKGTIMKRLKHRARGRSFAIQKPTCHVTIVDQHCCNCHKKLNGKKGYNYVVL